MIMSLEIEGFLFDETIVLLATTRVERRISLNESVLLCAKLL